MGHAPEVEKRSLTLGVSGRGGGGREVSEWRKLGGKKTVCVEGEGGGKDVVEDVCVGYHQQHPAHEISCRQERIFERLSSPCSCGHGEDL